MMRRVFLVSAGAMALAGTAFAAEPAPTPPPAYVPPPPMWTGFYIGVNAGYEWAASQTIQTSTANVFSIANLNGDIGGEVAALATGSRSFNPNGFIGGGQIGYNYQFANSWVAGIEADIDGIAGASRTGSLFQAGTVPGSFGIGGLPVGATSDLTWNKSIRYLGTVRGRVGWLLTPTLLIYGDGGLAYGGINASTGIIETLGYSDTPDVFGTSGRANTTRVGWTAGGGVEWMFLPNWSAKVEYLYYDLGNVTFHQDPLVQFGSFGTLLETIGTGVTSTRFNGSVIRAGINYHFNWGAPAPVVAKY